MGTVVLWFPARGERGLKEEHCAAAGERRGGGQRRREIFIGADQDQDLFFLLRLFCVFKQEVLSLVFSR